MLAGAVLVPGSLPLSVRVMVSVNTKGEKALENNDLAWL